MPIFTLRTIDGGQPAGFTEVSSTIRCSSMLLLLARVSTTMQSTGAEGNHQQSMT